MVDCCVFLCCNISYTLKVDCWVVESTSNMGGDDVVYFLLDFSLTDRCIVHRDVRDFDC